MTVTIKDVIRKHADDWRTLKAWGDVDMADVEVTVRNSKKNYSTGRAFEQHVTGKRRIVVTATPHDIVDSLGTILHEFAHIVVAEEVHGERWQRVFATAATEVTGIHIVQAASRSELLDRLVYEALEVWWARSSYSFAWRLIAAKKGSR